MSIISQGAQPSQPSCCLNNSLQTCLPILFHLFQPHTSIRSWAPPGHVCLTGWHRVGLLWAANQSGFAKWPCPDEDVFTGAALWEEQEPIWSDHKGTWLLLSWPSLWSKNIWGKINLFTCSRVPGNRFCFSFIKSLPEVGEQSGTSGQRQWEGELLPSEAEN